MVYYEKKKEVEKKISSVIKLVAESGVSINIVQKDLADFGEQKEALEEQIEKYEHNQRIIELSHDKILELLESSKTFIKNKDIHESRHFMKSYLKGVSIGAEDVVVVFNIPSVDKERNLTPLVITIPRKDIYKRYSNSKGGDK